MPHDHDHAHAGAVSRAFLIGVALNSIIVVTQVVYGLVAHSMALLADAGHNLGDVLGLALAWGAAHLAKRKPTKRHTYGMRRATILSALANAILLVVATGGVAWESISRLRAPGDVEAGTVVMVAGIAVVANGVSAAFFLRGGKRDVNVRAAFLHLAGDAAISLGVVVAGLVIARTGWTWLDPAVGLVVSGLILVSTWSLLRRSMRLALDAVPDGLELDEIRAYLAGLPGIAEVHDLHVWGMGATEAALTAHLVVAEGAALDACFLPDAARAIHEKFGIDHTTLQIEPPATTEPCSLAPEEVI